MLEVRKMLIGKKVFFAVLTAVFFAAHIGSGNPAR